MGNSNSFLIYIFFAPFGALTIIYTFRFIRTWVTYRIRLKYFRRQREIMRQRGQDAGDDERFEFELYYATWRGDRFEQIQANTGAIRFPHNPARPRQNFLLNNWDKQINVPSDHDDVCSICLNNMTSKDEVDTESNRQIGDNDPVQIPCGHIFHEKCIRNWAISHDNCPVCRFQPTKFKQTQATETLTVGTPLSTNITSLGVPQSLDTSESIHNNQTELSYIVVVVPIQPLVQANETSVQTV